MKQLPLYQVIARTFMALNQTIASGSSRWQDKHEARIMRLVADHMPSGSGFDNGTKLDFEASSPNKLVFNTSYHHMNDSGMYDGWTDHTVTVVPGLAFGFDIKIGGRDRNQIKEYIGEMFNTALSEAVDQYEAEEA